MQDELKMDEWFVWVLTRLKSTSYTSLEATAQLTQILGSFHEMDSKILRTSRHFQLRAFVLSLVEFCLHYKIDDSQLVGQVLQIVWDITGEFSLIFHRHKMILNIYEEKMDFSQDDVDVIVYFLRHSQRSKILFDGIRMVDIDSKVSSQPLVRAVRDRDLDKVRLLLTYGCKVELSYIRPNTELLQLLATSKPYHAYCRWMLCREMISCLRLLFCGMDFVEMSCLNTHGDNCSKGYSAVLSIVMLLLRSVPSIHPDLVVYSTPIQRKDYQFRKVHAIEMCKELDSKGFPLPILERFISPASLLHSCRCKIRETLNENWQLPDGISQLKLPTLVQEYLNLDHD